MTSQDPSSRSRKAADSSEQGGSGGSENLHLTTFTHDGRFWDVYLEFANDESRSDSFRARLCYVPTDSTSDVKPVRTAVIVIEPSHEEVLEKARALDRYSLAALLRSAS